jgi:hypothetical protein
MAIAPASADGYARARSVLRHNRVTSKHELKDLIMQAMDYFNQ